MEWHDMTLHESWTALASSTNDQVDPSTTTITITITITTVYVIITIYITTIITITTITTATTTNATVTTAAETSCLTFPVGDPPMQQAVAYYKYIVSPSSVSHSMEY